ncbi:MAG: hypothetical protein IPP44_14635 [Ideonella sp.]|nr:hypothetical protein [Ideonella sp.]
MNEDAPTPDAWSLALLSAALGALLVGMGRLHRQRHTQRPGPAGHGHRAGAGLRGAPASGRRCCGWTCSTARCFRLARWCRWPHGAMLFGSTHLLPVFAVAALHLPPATGAVLLPAGLALAFSIPLAGRLMTRFPLHLAVAFGLIGMAFSSLAMLAIGPETAIAWIVAAAVIGRIGWAS